MAMCIPYTVAHHSTRFTTTSPSTTTGMQSTAFLLMKVVDSSMTFLLQLFLICLTSLLKLPPRVTSSRSISQYITTLPVAAGK